VKAAVCERYGPPEVVQIREVRSRCRRTVRFWSSSKNDSSITAASYRTLMSLAERGVLKPVIDTVLPFTQIVQAHRRVDSGHKVGSVVLTFGQDG
jgi:NADPH:quinone reductase-like Zn-dependent oxidoreductase